MEESVDLAHQVCLEGVDAKILRGPDVQVCLGRSKLMRKVLARSFKCVLVAVGANISEEKSREGAQWSLNGIFYFLAKIEGDFNCARKWLAVSIRMIGKISQK